MQIENVPIVKGKGPDKWLLAEALFHDDEFPEDRIRTTFTVKRDGREFRLIVTISGIQKVAHEEGVYLIEGVGTVKTTGPNPEKVLDYVPVKLSYSVKSREGLANVNF